MEETCVRLYNNMSKKRRNSGAVPVRTTPVDAVPHPQDTQGHVARFEHFSGPLPPPSILAKYDEIVPGAANRIILKFEAQTEHRMTLEKSVVKTGNIKELVGLVLAFVVAMTAIVGGIVTAIMGTPFLGGSLSFAGLAVLVGAFLLRNRRRTNDSSSDKE